MKVVQDKYTICKAITELLAENNVICSVEQAMSSWWKNPRTNSGLRLSDNGYRAFEHAQLEYYDVLCTYETISEENKMVIELNKKLKCPYYLLKTKTSLTVRLYDSRLAVLINLYGGLNDYINTL